MADLLKHHCDICDASPGMSCQDAEGYEISPHVERNQQPAPKITILDPGFTGCYIHDLSARGWRVTRACKVPYEEAIQHVKNLAPEARMGGCLGKELEVGRRAHQWHNKLYVTVLYLPANPMGCLALFNQDGTIYLYTLTKEA